MRTVVLLAVVTISGCSFLVQDHLPSEYSGNSEPMCETGKGPAVVDTVFAILNIGGAIAVAALPDDGTPGRSDAIAGSLIDGALFVASAVAGYSWAGECRDARRRWSDIEAEQAQHDRLVEQRKLAAEARRAETPTDVDRPRGFFCAASESQPNVGLCVRDKDSCARARDALATAVPDVGQCALQESAWCLGNRCATTEAACEARRGEAGSDALACQEQQ